MRAQDEPKPAWAYSSETRGRRREWGFRRLPQSFSSRDAQAPARARCAGPGPGVRQVHPATHLGKEAVHCSGARTFPARLQSRKSAQRQVPGSHACHRAPRGDSSPRSRRTAMPRSLLLSRTFCPRLGPPPSQLQPLSPLPPSSSLLGEALPGGEQLVAHSSRAGGGRQGAGDAPASLCAPPGALGSSGGYCGSPARQQR